MRCPKCKGEGRRHFLAAMGKWRSVTCSFCSGTGQISGAQLTWLAAAPVLNELRGSLGITMCQASAMAHTTVMRWNEAEHGRTNPDQMIHVMRRQGATM
jgi:hypothetical protein